VRIIDPETMHINRDVPAIEGWAYAIAPAGDGQSVLAAGAQGQLRRVLLDTPSP
jgi:hypothetical protein